MGMLGRDKLLEKEELQIEKVNLDKGDFVYVRQMTGRERDRFEQSLMIESRNKEGQLEYTRNLSDFRAKLAATTLCDETGVNLLEQKDIPTLSQAMSAARLDKITTEAQKLNKITNEDRDNLIKNSEGGQTADSDSDSV